MGDIHFSILTNWLGLRILNLTTQARFLRVRSGESAVGPATLKWKGERMRTRQALARFGLHNLEQREERILSSLSSGLNRLGGYILDVAVVLQITAGVVILLGDPEPFRNTVSYLRNVGWFYTLQQEAFAILLLAAIITGVWGIAQRKIPTRAMQAARRFGAWFIKIGAPIR